MKALFSIIFFFAVLIYISEPKISFKPFEVKFQSPYMSAGIFCLILMLVFLGKHYQDKGFKKGVELSIKEIQKLNKED